MSSACVKHPMAEGDFVCGTCGHDYCPECVVFPFGPSKPAMCITCALVAGGVRRRPTDHPRLHRREVRRRIRRGGRAVEEPATPEPLPEPAATSEDFVGLEHPEDLPGGWRMTF